MRKNNVIKMFGTLFLFVGALVVTPNSLLFWNQPKCPDELLK